MTENQLKLNDDKTEALLFPFSSYLRPSTVSLPGSITLGSHNIPFPDSARNLGVGYDNIFFSTCPVGQEDEFSTCPSGKTSCPCQILKINHFD